MSQAQTQAQSADVAGLLSGVVDTHVHSGPSIAERGIDHLELVREASAAGFAAVVIKDHDYSGGACAALIEKHNPELKTRIFASIVLNNAVGGMNPYAVEHMAALGGKIVWMPTLAAENHLKWQASSSRRHPGASEKMRQPVGVPVLNDDKTVRDDAKEVLDVIARTGIALASGHLHISETWIVFEEAKRRGVKRLILTHPESIVEATLNDVRGMAAMGVMIEHSLCLFIEGSKFKRFDGELLRQHIEAAGVKQTILCSDQGQRGEMSPVEGFKRVIPLCLELGYSPEDIRQMISLNPAEMLGINVAHRGSA